jgi:hypothetical protein
MTATRIAQETLKFVDYVHGFYGPGGVYPMGATVSQICDATKILLEQYGTNVEFDSVDRERVRDILISHFGLKWPS